MDVYDVEAKVSAIQELAADSEIQHAIEDEVRDEVLRAIALGDENAQELAIAVLKTSDIKFTRYYS